MRKQFWGGLIAMIAIITAVISWTTFTAHQATNNYTYSNIPTLYLHGYGGGASASNHQIAAAEKAGAATKVLTARVTKAGHVKLSGHWRSGKVNPLVQVIFEDNRNPDFKTDGQWLKNILTTLQSRYHIKQFNVVAHSMGNMAVMYYETANGQNKKLPQLNKQVDLAGHFDGILGRGDKPNQNRLLANGQPKTMDQNYRYLLAHINNYPSRQVRVLNIYGNLEDGSNSDGRVSNVSSRSLKYLLGNRPISYQEHMIKGKDAQHSKLHNNGQVNRLVINFLWGK